MVRSLRLLDPLLQLLTKRTGKTTISLTILHATLPVAARRQQQQCLLLLQHIPELAQRGILSLIHKKHKKKDDNSATATTTTTTTAVPTGISWDDPHVEVGFPEPPSANDTNFLELHQQKCATGSLSGSTKTAAKRRLSVLKRQLKQQDKQQQQQHKQTKQQQQPMERNNTTNKPDVDDSKPAPPSSNSASIVDDNDAVAMETQEEQEEGCCITHSVDISQCTVRKEWDPSELRDITANEDEIEGKKEQENNDDDDVVRSSCSEEKNARMALQQIFCFQECPKPQQQSLQSSSSSLQQQQQKQDEPPVSKNAIPTTILPKQASYAGSNPKQSSNFGTLSNSKNVLEQIPNVLLDAFQLEHPQSTPSSNTNRKINQRKLYSHQTTAIDSAMRGCHTLVCTSTGSGKSLCFLLPVLVAAYQGVNDQQISRSKSLIMFPTKALAQDQLGKLQSLLSTNDELQQRIVPATLDGDCPHEQRSSIAKTANVILTNPDTVHAAILPNWKKTYKTLLARLKYVVIDEAHVYEGIFGSNVAMILARLHRLCIAAATDDEQENTAIVTPTFLASSATLSHPEHQMRLLCPIPKDVPLTVLTPKDDGSPRSAKHFFVWNPPILDVDGRSTGSVFPPKPKPKKANKDCVGQQHGQHNTREKKKQQNGISKASAMGLPFDSYGGDELTDASEQKAAIFQPSHARSGVHGHDLFRRRHAADETALLLARAVANNVRCIAFCKTRTVCEWVYERTIAALRSDDDTSDLAARVESYRGGYQLNDRREIEKKLFQRHVLGVVATSALELGVDIGGIDLTLHCGYPSSISSLLQQAGRAGRGGAALSTPSLSVVVCFGSASEQHMWRRPECLLGRAISAALSIPINTWLVQGHLLCASKEYPLTGTLPVSILSNRPSLHDNEKHERILNDRDLFGATYDEALENLLRNGSVQRHTVPSNTCCGKVVVYKSHALIDKPCTSVSIRSIEPVQFSIVDISRQGGKMDTIQNENAVLDTLPYSRVFYHAFPGAIILFRGTKYRVLAMTRPVRGKKTLSTAYIWKSCVTNGVI